MAKRTSEIKDLESRRKPLDDRLKNGSEELSKLKKEMKSNVKSIEKLLKGIKKSKESIEKLSKDDLLETEEREFRRKKSESELSSFTADLSRREKNIPELKSNIDGLTDEIIHLEKKIGKFNSDIKKIKDEIEAFKNVNDDIVKKLVKEKGKVAASLSLENGKLDTNYFLLGDLADKVRPKDEFLGKIFKEIDDKREILKNMQREREAIGNKS